jgi:superfamily II DNA or RNA helicase
VAGFDSDVRCIIYARPTKSEIRWLQALGRGLRTAPGKESCLIFDHSGTAPFGLSGFNRVRRSSR